jgi:hypothetical protein
VHLRSNHAVVSIRKNPEKIIDTSTRNSSQQLVEHGVGRSVTKDVELISDIALACGANASTMSVCKFEGRSKATYSSAKSSLASVNAVTFSSREQSLASIAI